MTTGPLQRSRRPSHRRTRTHATLTAMTWSDLLPSILGSLPLAGRLTRTDPGGRCPAPIAIVGLYPAVTKVGLYTCADGSKIKLPVEVEGRSFQHSASATELEDRHLKPLGLTMDHVSTIDLYPYYLANTADSGGRSMADNVARYEKETATETAVKPRPPPDAMVALCRALPGNAERIADHFQRCRPALVITLGNEVAAFVRGYAVAAKAQGHLYGPAIDTAVFGIPLRVVHCRHPGVFIRAKGHKGVEEHERWCSGPGRALVREALSTWPPP